MPKEMIINAFVPENVRVAILEDKRLNAFFEDFARDHRSRSNIYLGRIIHIEPSLDACFVDFGKERHGFLPFSEIAPIYRQSNSSKTADKRIEKKVKRGQLLVVQVDKEAVGSKGAKLTTYLSLAGRYMVLMPYSDTRGVSRKIDDPETRKGRKEIIDKLNVPKGMGLILRTAGEDKNKRELTRDLNYLNRLWKEIQKKARKFTGPGLIHAEADLIQRILRDYYTSDIERVWIDDPVALSKAENFFKLFMPRQKRTLRFFSEKLPIFSHFEIESQIEEIHSRRVLLPSGGSLVIDPTEALVAIDVNSGKMKSKNQETTAFETNLEAVKEVARQLALRDLGGIVVIDLIDMTNGSHKTTVERTLRDELRKGKARTKIGKISSFGLCTLTRQRLGRSIRTLGQRECPTCMGSGLIPDLDVVSMRLMRKLRAEAASGKFKSVRVILALDLANHFQNRFRSEINIIERELDMEVFIEASSSANSQGFEIVYVERKKVEPNQNSRVKKDKERANQAVTTKPNVSHESKKTYTVRKPETVPSEDPAKKREKKSKKFNQPKNNKTAPRASKMKQGENKTSGVVPAKQKPRKRNWRRKKTLTVGDKKQDTDTKLVHGTNHTSPESSLPGHETMNPVSSDTSASTKEEKKKTNSKKRKPWKTKKVKIDDS